MNIIKIITVLNWVVIAILAFLVIAETLTPTKGGDAAGKGIGQAIYYLAIIAFFVLLGLNLLPYNWAKYTAFALVVLPVLFIKIAPSWRSLQRDIRNMREDAKPIFDDKERDQIARAIRDGKMETVKNLLQSTPSHLIEDGELLGYAIGEANHSSYKPQEKLEIVRLFFQAGAKLDSANSGLEVPLHFAVADVGKAALLRLLLEQGADVNAVHHYFKRHILFEAVGSHGEPEATVKTLLDFGANPNATAMYDEEQGPITPLWRAAELERWGICATLIERGADPNVKTADGKTFRSLVEEASKNFTPHYFATQEDFDRLKKALR